MINEKLIGSQELLSMLKQRYGGRGWIGFHEFYNMTGYHLPGMVRHADYIALAAWPSLGLKILGFEIKTSQTDLKRELKHPEKGQAIKQYCDEWYLVIPNEKLIEGIEIPDDWGIMCARLSGLEIVIPAPKLIPKPYSREFIASLMVRLHRHYHDPVRQIKEICDGM